MSTYIFEKPLIRGKMLKRKSQFTALVEIDGEELVAHIPTTNRIGDGVQVPQLGLGTQIQRLEQTPGCKGSQTDRYKEFRKKANMCHKLRKHPKLWHNNCKWVNKPAFMEKWR